MTVAAPVTRRSFLAQAFATGAFVVGVRLGPLEAFAGPDAIAGSIPAWMPSVYVGIEPDGTVKIVAHRSEMGTGVRTGLPMIVADELEADWSRVTVVQALGDVKYGSQNTDGSCSVKDFYDAMRTAGATARTMLEQAAAARWNVPAADCLGQAHFVVHGASGRKIAYGDLVAAAAALPVPPPASLRLKTPAEFKYIGKDVPVVDRRAYVTGKAVFGIDARMDGMVYAAIERPPVLGQSVVSIDDTAARKVPGVLRVVRLDGPTEPYLFKALGGAAVIATSTWAALRGREALKVQWSASPNAGYDSTAYRDALVAAAKAPQRVVRNVGDVDAEFAKGGTVVEATYSTPLLAHAPMEPPAAVAEFKAGKVVTFAATQNPQAVQEAVAAALGIRKEDVQCHVTLLGGGFGRKSKPDYVVEAALLSRDVGKPVKIVWTREDDLRFDYFHGPSAMHMKASVDAAGRPLAWLQRTAFPPIASLFQAGEKYGGFQTGMGFTDIPYAVPNLRVENGPAVPHVRIGWMRSVAHIHHAFAVQSFTDELAAASGRDRVEYLLDLIGPPRVIDLGREGVTPAPEPDVRFPFDTGRLRNVITRVADEAGWSSRKPSKGRALGVAAHYSFLCYVAAVVDVEVLQGGTVKIHRVDVALDTGRVINPDRVRAQFEGAAVFGATLALFGELTAKAGRVEQTNFDGYEVARMNDVTFSTHVHIVPSDAPPAGVGEPGVPPIAPAICNAIYAATGTRVRDLPIRKVT
jgi:isoquinoline 1-oxidoreductase beta subunit